MSKLKVKFKKITWANYDNLGLHPGTEKDPGTLYFISDKKVIYRGETLLSDKLDGIEIMPKVTNGLTSATMSVVTMKMYSGQQLTFDMVNTEVFDTLLSNYNLHIKSNGNSTAAGHVKLSDYSNKDNDTSKGIAATPKAVYEAAEGAKKYADTLIAGLGSLLRIKGTIGTSAADTAADIPTLDYEVGDSYLVTATGTYGKSEYFEGFQCEPGDLIIAFEKTRGINDWKVLQANIMADAMMNHNHDLNSDSVTGTLPLSKGGLGMTELEANFVLVGQGTGVKALGTRKISNKVLANSTDLVDSDSIAKAIDIAKSEAISEAGAVWEDDDEE